MDFEHITKQEYNRYRDKLRKRSERAQEKLPGQLKDIEKRFYKENAMPTWAEFQKLRTTSKAKVFNKAAKYENSPLSTTKGYEAYRAQTEKTLSKRKSARSGLGKDENGKQRFLSKEDVRELQKLLGSTQKRKKGDNNVGIEGRRLSSDQIIEIFSQSISKEGKSAKEAAADIEGILDSYASQREVSEALSERELELKKKKRKKQSNKR